MGPEVRGAVLTLSPRAPEPAGGDQPSLHNKHNLLQDTAATLETEYINYRLPSWSGQGGRGQSKEAPTAGRLPETASPQEGVQEEIPEHPEQGGLLRGV